MKLNSSGLRAQIPFLSKIAYLDSASVAPASNLALEAMRNYATEFPLNYGVGVFAASKMASAKVDEVRKKLADFIHASSPDESSSYSGSGFTSGFSFARSCAASFFSCNASSPEESSSYSGSGSPALMSSR